MPPKAALLGAKHAWVGSKQEPKGKATEAGPSAAADFNINVFQRNCFGAGLTDAFRSRTPQGKACQGREQAGA